MKRWHPADRGGPRTFEVFLHTFEKFKNDIDDDENGLDELVQNDEGISSALCKLYWLRSQVDDRMRSSSKGFSQTSPSFRKTILEFDRRFRDVAGREVVRNAIIWVPPDPVEESEEDNEPQYPVDPAEHLEEMIDIVRDYVEEGRELTLWSELPERDAVTFLAGVETWEELQKSISLDPSAILRRRRAMPYLLLGQTSEKIRKSEIIRMIEDAQKSYIFGANLSAIATLRSIFEEVFKVYFQLGNDESRLLDLMNEYSRKFKISEELASDIHNFRKLANNILHEPETVTMSTDEFEKIMVKNFNLVQRVIEDVPRI